MKLKIIREKFTEKSTIGRLFIDDAETCFTLEDTDQKLEIHGCSSKIYGETCIPRGTYRVIIDHSQHFGCDMPHVIGIPCFEGIRIHVGNRPIDTEGCVLLGLGKGNDFISHSRAAFDVFFIDLQSGLAQGEVWLEVV